MVEHQIVDLVAAGSSPVVRPRINNPRFSAGLLCGR